MIIVRLLGQWGAFDIVVARVSILAVSPNPLAVFPEQEGDRAAEQADAGKEGAGPLISEAMVHLGREEHDAGTPEGADEGLGGERGGRAVLVRVDEVVVGRVVEEDEAEADRETGERRADPDEARVRRPGEDDHAERNEPAREHHGDQAELGGRELPGVRLDDLQVVLVHQGRAHG